MTDLDLNEDLLTVKEAAALLRVSEKWVYRVLGTPAGPPAIRLGSHWRISRNRLDAWIKAQFADAS